MAVDPRSDAEHRRRFFIALCLFAAFTLSMALVNLVASWSGGDDESPYMMAAGLFMALVSFPVLCIGVPLWLVRRWELPRSWLPPREQLGVALAIGFLYVYLANFYGILELTASGPDPLTFLIHFISATLFHVPYYALFASLLFPTARDYGGLRFALVVTAGAFALFHLSTFYFFPAGLHPLFLVGLFAAFVVDLLVYLLTRSLLLVAAAHSVNGAVGLASQGELFAEPDFFFVVTIVIVGGLITYGLLDHRRLRGRPAEDAHEDFWLRVDGGS